MTILCSSLFLVEHTNSALMRQLHNLTAYTQNHSKRKRKQLNAFILWCSALNSGIANGLVTDKLWVCVYRRKILIPPLVIFSLLNISGFRNKIVDGNTIQWDGLTLSLPHAVWGQLPNGFVTDLLLADRYQKLWQWSHDGNREVGKGAPSGSFDHLTLCPVP